VLWGDVEVEGERPRVQGGTFYGSQVRRYTPSLFTIHRDPGMPEGPGKGNGFFWGGGKSKSRGVRGPALNRFLH